MAQTLNKDALVNRIYEFDNFETKKQSKEFLEDLLAIITDEVAAGNTVSIAGFGKFEAYTSTTTGKVTPKFRVFKDFQDAVAK